VDINTAWETITENTNISDKASLGYYEMKKRKHGSTMFRITGSKQTNQIAVVTGYKQNK
jgi:hypothetical protein